MFCGKRCDRIKVLLREHDGYVLLYKKLKDVHGRYRWPRNKSEVKAITWQQFDWLMSKPAKSKAGTTLANHKVKCH